MRPNRFLPAAAALAAGALLLPADHAAGKPSWKPLFNGTSFAPDWYVIGEPRYWSIDPKDSSIVASSGAEEAVRTLLATQRKDFDQFTVKYAYRLKAGCSGFFFRSSQSGTGTVGAQVEAKIENGKMEEVGSIYAMPQPGWVVQHPAAWSARVAPDANAWQKVLLTVKRPYIYVNVNGVQAVGETHPDSIARGAKPAWDYTRTPALANPGQFALQIHVGEVMDVRFKDIAILRGCGDSASARYDGKFVEGHPKHPAVYEDDGSCDAASLTATPGSAHEAGRYLAAPRRLGGDVFLEVSYPGAHALELVSLEGRTVFSGAAPSAQAYRIGGIRGPGIYIARLKVEGRTGHAAIRRVVMP